MKLYKSVNMKTKKVCYIKCRCGIETEIRNQSRIALKDPVTEFQKELASGDHLDYSLIGDFKKESSADKKVSELNGVITNIEEPQISNEEIEPIRADIMDGSAYKKKKKSKKEKDCVNYLQED